MARLPYLITHAAGLSSARPGPARSRAGEPAGRNQLTAAYTRLHRFSVDIPAQTSPIAASGETISGEATSPGARALP